MVFSGSTAAETTPALSVLGHFRVGQHGLGRRQVSFALLEAAEVLDDAPHLGLFARKAAVALDVTGHLRVGQGRIQLCQPQGQAFELFAQGRVHEQWPVHSRAAPRCRPA